MMDDISSNIDQQLIDAYKATTYQVIRLGISLRIGEKNWQMEEFLIDNNEFNYAFISALNPYSQALSYWENEDRHQKLILWLKNQSYRYATGHGKPDNDNWEPEKSVLIIGITKEDAIKLGNELEQNAIIFGHLGQAPELVLLR